MVILQTTPAQLLNPGQCIHQACISSIVSGSHDRKKLKAVQIMSFVTCFRGVFKYRDLIPLSYQAKSVELNVF